MLSYFCGDPVSDKEVENSMNLRVVVGNWFDDDQGISIKELIDNLSNSL